MGDDIQLNVTLEEKENDSFQVGIGVLVTDSSGTPLPDATILIESENTGYSKKKSAKNHGMNRQFDDVPLPATATISQDGYKSVRTTLRQSDAGETIRKEP